MVTLGKIMVYIFTDHFSKQMRLPYDRCIAHVHNFSFMIDQELDFSYTNSKLYQIKSHKLELFLHKKTADF